MNAFASTGNSEVFVVAFAQKDTGNVKVRFSEDKGVTWKDGNFPATSTTNHGVGIMTDGITEILNRDNGHKIDFTYSLGPALWDQSPVQGSTNTLNTAPMGVSIGNSKYLITFVNSSNKVVVNMWDSNSKTLSYVPSPTLSNENVFYESSIAYSNSTVVLVWLKLGKTNADKNSLMSATGTINENVVSWNTPKEIPSSIVSNSTVSGDYLGGPSVTSDGLNFYLVVNGDNSGKYTSYKNFVLKSNNGITWNEMGIISGPGSSSCVAIAAQSDGTVLVSSTRACDDIISSTSSFVYTWKFDPNSGWSDLTSTNIFGNSNIYPKEFSLVSYQKPNTTNTTSSSTPGWSFFIITISMTVIYVNKKIKNRI